jgi:lysyl-tRNA synthetase class 2
MAGETWSDMFSRILSEKVEPHLGQGRLTVLDRYPAAEAALARRCRGSAGGRAVRGLCLRGGTGQRLWRTDRPGRAAPAVSGRDGGEGRRYGETYPIDEDFLAALALMPPAAGCALGFDRLVMLATGAPRISDVMWVPAA